jgi:hypothetical protein
MIYLRRKDLTSKKGTHHQRANAKDQEISSASRLQEISQWRGMTVGWCVQRKFDKDLGAVRI